jgi:hypothetical protein
MSFVFAGFQNLIRAREQVFTSWTCAAFANNLPERRRVLAAMALSASRRFGAALAHLGVALARAGLRQAAVTIAARALASTAADYGSFTPARSGSHGFSQPMGNLAWYAGKQACGWVAELFPCALAYPDGQHSWRASCSWRLCMWADKCDGLVV